MKKSLNTLPYFPNPITKQVFSSACSTSGTQMLDFIVLQVSKFHYTSNFNFFTQERRSHNISLVKAERCYVTLKYKIYLPVRIQTGNKSMHPEGKNQSTSTVNTALNNIQI